MATTLIIATVTCLAWLLYLAWILRPNHPADPTNDHRLRPDKTGDGGSKTAASEATTLSGTNAERQARLQAFYEDLRRLDDLIVEGEGRRDPEVAISAYRSADQLLQMGLSAQAMFNMALAYGVNRGTMDGFEHFEQYFQSRDVVPEIARQLGVPLLVGVPVRTVRDEFRFLEEVNVAKGEMLVRLGRHAEAEHFLAGYVVASSHNPRAHRFSYVRALSRLACQQWSQALEDLRQVAEADANYKDVQKHLKELEARLNTESEPQVSKDSEAPRTAWEILGVAKGATKAEIRAAYKRRASEYHPDRVAHLGERIRVVAEEEMRSINRAYEALSA